MEFQYIKSLHIIFVVTWFAGLFYLPRLMVYSAEADALKDEHARNTLLKQYQIMKRRLLFGITWPSAIITACMGTTLLVTTPAWLQFSFMHIKLTLVFFLYLYHLSLHRIFKQLQRGVVTYTSQQMRFWNEVSTLFLIAIVFLIVLKDALSMVWGLLGLFGVVILITIGIKLYKKYRK